MDTDSTLPLDFVEYVSPGEAAVYYAAQFAWPVFPIPEGGREPFPGSRGFIDASSDPAIVGEMWGLRGNSANVALATGEKSQLLVVDIDRHGEVNGEDTLATLEQTHGALPRTLTATTPRNGRHLFFKYPEGGKWGNTAKRIGPGIDTRGEGGYVILAPSVVTEYGTYKWVDTHVPVEAPEWLLGLLAKRSHEHEQQEAAWDRADDEITRYVRAVVTDECAELARMTEGGRNDRLNRAAFALGTIGAHGALTEDYARTALLAACEECGLLEDSGLRSCLATIASGWAAGMRSPRQPWPPKPADPAEGLDFGPAPGTRDSGTSGHMGPDSFFGRDGLEAETLAREVLNVGPLRVGDDGEFWSYHEGVWSHDKHAVHKRVARLLRNRFRNAHADNVAALIRFTVARISAEPISAYVNCRSGMLEWATGEMKPHDPSYASTVQLPWEWDAEAECPEFDRFLAEVVPPDMVPLMWEVIGYMQYSGNPLQKAFMLLGKGGNGKGTFLRVLGALLGGGNISAVTLDSLSANRFSPASLYGKLANLAGDIDATYQESTAMFKKITGEDDIDAERKYGQAFTFRPWATPIFSANKVPGSADTSEGYRRRWVILPFPNHFAGKKADPHLTERLVSEIPGIARHALHSLRDLMLRGYFEMPESADAAKEDFTRRIDVVRGWIGDACDLTPGSFTPRSVLYASFRNWAQLNGHKVLRSTEFYDRVESAGCKPVKRRGMRGFCDITVTEGRVAGVGFEWNAPNVEDDE